MDKSIIIWNQKNKKIVFIVHSSFSLYILYLYLFLYFLQTAS